MARAVRYNLASRIKEVEQQMAENRSAASFWTFMPKVVGDASHTVTALVDDRVDQMARIPIETIGEPLLSSTNGGPVAADRDAAGRFRVRASIS